jgi:hypothetical protein
MGGKILRGRRKFRTSFTHLHAEGLWAFKRDVCTAGLWAVVRMGRHYFGYYAKPSNGASLLVEVE